MNIPEIPVEFLKNINDHTAGGFILFYIDVNGDPQFKQVVDNRTLFRGLVSYIEDTIESIRAIDKDYRVTELHGEDETEDL